MKLFLVLLITYLARANSQIITYPTLEELEEPYKHAVIDCARELNINASKLVRDFDLQKYMSNPDESTTCMAACYFRTLTPKISKKLQGLNHKETLYNGFMMVTDETYKQVGLELLKYPRADVINKIENCFAKEQTECKFFSCIEITQPPYLNTIMGFMFTDVQLEH